MKTLQVKHQGVDRELLARVEALGATLRPTPVVLEQVLAGEVGHQLGGDLEPMAGSASISIGSAAHDC